MAVLEMACPRPRSRLQAAPPKVTRPGCCKLAGCYYCCCYCCCHWRPGIGGSSNLCFSVPGNLGMDRLGAILLEGEASWRMGLPGLALHDLGKGHHPAVLHEMSCQLPR